MHIPVVRNAAFAAAVLILTSTSASAGPCSATNLASFSRLGQVVEDARAGSPGKLLATWLLRSRGTGTCKFIFRIDLLLLDGRVLSMNFDAETLEPVEIYDDDGWENAGNTDEGDETAGTPGHGSGAGSSPSSAPDDNDNDDDGSDDDGGDDGDDDDRGDDGRGDDGGDDGGGDDGGGDGGGGDGGGGDD